MELGLFLLFPTFIAFLFRISFHLAKLLVVDEISYHIVFSRSFTVLID